MEGQKIFKVWIRYNGSSAFEYLSNQSYMPMAVACAVRKLYIKNIAITPAESRIDSIQVTRISRSEAEDSEVEVEGHYEGGPA